MAGTDLVQRTKETAALLDHPTFLDQVEALLPETLPVRRFVQVAKTAIRTNPDLVDADQTSLFGSIIRCAQDGLIPDGHEAALVPYKGKVSYLPMIGGLRKRLAEYGWTLKTRVVYSNDEFDYSEEPPLLRHVPVRPGLERGERIAAYAVATHRDGRRLQLVLDKSEVEKRKAKAQTQAVWNEWPDAMWEKTAGHAIEASIPKAERDRMTLPVEDEVGPEAAAELLYGPDGSMFTATPAPAAALEAASAAAGADGQQAGSSAETPSAVDEPVPGEDPEPAAPWEAAGDVEIMFGAWQGKTLRQLADSDSGREWLAWALRNPGRLEDDFYASVSAYVEGALFDLWQTHTERSAA